MAFNFKFDHSKPGLRKVFKEYQELVLRCVWEKGEQGVGSRAVREYVLERQTERKKISQASIIGFLEKLRKGGVLRHIEETSRGGHRKIYYPLIDEESLVKQIAITMVHSLMRDFPVETQEYLDESGYFSE